MADNEKLSQLDFLSLPVRSGDIIYIIRSDGLGGYDSFKVAVSDLPAGAGSGLTTLVSMPANTAASGAVGQYAADGNMFAVYVASVGWMFFQGFQI